MSDLLLCGWWRYSQRIQIFKTGVSSDPAQAGSIPVRLRYQHFCFLVFTRLREDACLLARGLAVLPSSAVPARQAGDPEAGRLLAGQVYAGPDPLTGKQRFEYDRAKTKREAVRVEAALKTKVAEVVAAAPPRGQSPT